MKKINIGFIVILLLGLLGLAGCGSQEGGAEPLQSTLILPETDGERPESGVEESSGVGANPQDDQIQEDAATENIQADTEQTGDVQKEEESKSSSGHYLMITSLSDEEVENFAAKVKEQILESDFAGLAEEIAYPITIDGVTYEDASAFLGASMTLEMNPDSLAELEAESCREMFANYQGIMMGNGIVWIGSVDGELKVIGINGMAVQ